MTAEVAIFPATRATKRWPMLRSKIDGHPRIRAGEHGGERLLLFGRLRLEYVEIFGERGHSALGKGPVAVNQLLQRRLGVSEVCADTARPVNPKNAAVAAPANVPRKNPRLEYSIADPRSVQ
jgi:hypothetical protein